MEALSTTSMSMMMAHHGISGAMERLVCVVVVMVVLRVELYRRALTGPNLGSRQSFGYAESCKRILRSCAPEAAGLLACLTLAAVLRARGDTGVVPDNSAAWEEIKRQWPLLLTADTLLSLQAMLRLLVLLCAVLRLRAASPDSGNASLPLSDETSVLWLVAGLARVGMFSRSSAYMLDGPLGGMVPATCEILAIPLLLVLSGPSLHRAPAKFAMALVAMMFLSTRHRLGLADDHIIDGLWTLAHTCDFFMAFAYLLRTLLIDMGCRGDASVGFTHLVITIQQGLAAYYFCTAFDYSPELVSVGLPFDILQIGSIAQLGAFLGATAMYLAECFAESPSQGIATTPGVGLTL